MINGHGREDQVRPNGLFRYSVISEEADRQLSSKQPGRLVRDLSAREHVGPIGDPVRVSRATIYCWIRDWGRGGFDALVPIGGGSGPRTPAEVLDPRRRLEARGAGSDVAQVAAILRAHAGWAPEQRTLQRHFVRLELNTRPDGQPPKAFGRFEGRHGAGFLIALDVPGVDPAAVESALSVTW